jgi:hypothetical protein
MARDLSQLLFRWRSGGSIRSTLHHLLPNLSQLFLSLADLGPCLLVCLVGFLLLFTLLLSHLSLQECFREVTLGLVSAHFNDNGAISSWRLGVACTTGGEVLGVGVVQLALANRASELHRSVACD